MNAVLVMFKADGERKDLPLTKPVMILGRKHTCDLRIPLSSVSREHCQIERRGDDLYVRDLGSSNGTYHNETRVLESKLKAGDSLQVGPVHFTVVIDGQPDDIEPVRSIIPDEDEMTGTPPRGTPGTPGAAKPAVKSGPAKPAGKSPPADEDIEDLDSLDELEGLEELGELEDIDDLEILEDDEDDEDSYARPQTPPAQAVTPAPAPPPKPSPTSATPKPKAPAPPPPPTDDDPIAALEALMNGDEDDEDDEPITLNFDDDDDER